MVRQPNAIRLQQTIDRARDHVRGGTAPDHRVSIVLYGDYLCPYCRRLRPVLDRLRAALGQRLAYVFRHFPMEGPHPGAEQAAYAAEAAGRQDRFWEMHDLLYSQEPPIDAARIEAFARQLDLDMPRFRQDIASDDVRAHVAADLAEGRHNGVTGTPTLFINGLRYDGAWDLYSMLEALELPVAVRLERSARVFASLPAAGGLVLLLAAAAALLCANSPLAPYYRVFVESSFNIGPAGRQLSLTVGEWFSEGLLAIFFLVVGLEIRRELTVGALADRRAALLPVIAAVGGVLAPTAIYLAINRGPTAVGWSVPTATDIAFALGILALLGNRVPTALRVFVAALAVADDVLSVLTLAIFYPRSFHILWLAVAAGAFVLLFLLNRARIRAGWPYALVTVALWFALHAAGVHAALAGVILAAFVPTRPAPAAAPLLAQAATALAELEYAEREIGHEGSGSRRLEQEPIWDWASRNLSAAVERLLSPADRLERAVSPWTAYVILPLFAFSATGVRFDADLSTPEARMILFGVAAGLIFGKPIGVSFAAALAIKLRWAIAPDEVSLRSFVGAACLCGVGDTVALLMADQAFPVDHYAEIAKLGVLIGSVVAALLGAAILATGQPEARHGAG
jgi:NhaA family Na+:H+ antiporter